MVLDDLDFLHPCFSKLKERCRSPDQRIWTFEPGDLTIRIQEAFEALGVAAMGVAAYGLRHGGASHDLLAKRRSPLEVKARGRWRSDAMMKRYGKEARALAELHKSPQAVLDFGSAVQANLASIVLEGVALPPAPVLARLG
eukprot:3464195-Pyramimonas_sp.AAC.1